MILQYKGFNNNWCYEEAEIISFANVWVGEETRKYRQDGIRFKEYDDKLRGTRSEEKINNVELQRVKELHDAVNRLIKEETHCSDDIIYNINCSFEQMENVIVIILKDKNKFITYVFEQANHGIYLLNNNGQTIQKL